MATSRRAGATQATGQPSLVGAVKLVSRLAPKQLADELELAKTELKRKGIQAGIASAFFVVALLFVAALAVALIMAAVMGLATVMPAWLSALIFGLLFVIIAGIGAMLGLSRFKKAMPLLPEQAIRGVKYDIGVLKEGRRFDPSTLDKKSPADENRDKAKQEEKARAKAEKAAQPPAPSESELQTRTGERREHLTGLREDLGEELDVKKKFEELMVAVKGTAGARLSGAGATPSGRRAAGQPATAGEAKPVVLPEDVINTVMDRWKPLSVLGASLAAVAVLARKLGKS